MHEHLADFVYPVLSAGLELKQQLTRGGEAPDFRVAQSRLNGLLQGNPGTPRHPDYEGDSSFLGAKYALVCWLDETFILDSPWGERWNNKKLETEIYGTNLRAEKFWAQARLARTRSGSDAVEVYFLCVMLGFRGAARQDLAGLRSWFEEVKVQIAKAQSEEWQAPAANPPPTSVPPLHGRGRLRAMLATAGAVLVFVLLAAVVIISGSDKQASTTSDSAETEGSP